jgi:hypothetical protein
MHGITETLPSGPPVAAAAIARLDSALARHPLAPAWAYRARLDAVHRQAAVDGRSIDPWHLAALIEGVRLRLDAPARRCQVGVSGRPWQSARDDDVSEPVSRLPPRTDETEATEVAIAVAALNRMLEFGRPNYVRMA